MNTNNKDIIKSSSNYKYGFKDKDVSIFSTPKGLSKEIVTEISKQKNEPQWMLDIRLKAYEMFLKLPNPKYGPDLSKIDFNDFTYYKKVSPKPEDSWDKVPETVKNTFNKLKIPESEQKFLAGVSGQYESEVVYHNMLQEVKDKGVIFLDTDSALKLYPDLFKQYFGKLVSYADNKYAALNTACWSGGSFIYVPKGVKLEKPLQSYFRINSTNMGQFERTLIIVDEGASLHYVEGCTAPIYSSDSMHAAVVEIFVNPYAKCRYSTIQNWSTNIINLVTKRALVKEFGLMEWIDGNIGSSINMKYPCCVLDGINASGQCISIAVGSNSQFQDAGAKMIHNAPNTTSNIVSKSLTRKGATVNYRGLVKINKLADNSKAKVSCDTLILDDASYTDTIPTNINNSDTSYIEHEATVSKISDEQIFYLQSRGLSKQAAIEMIVMGFIEPFSRELPMEYAVELNQLLKMNMAGSIG